MKAAINRQADLVNTAAKLLPVAQLGWATLIKREDWWHLNWSNTQTEVLQTASDVLPEIQLCSLSSVRFAGVRGFELASVNWMRPARRSVCVYQP